MHIKFVIYILIQNLFSYTKSLKTNFYPFKNINFKAKILYKIPKKFNKYKL